MKIKRISSYQASNLWDAMMTQLDACYDVGHSGNDGSDFEPEHDKNVRCQYQQALTQLIYRFMEATGWQPKEINNWNHGHIRQAGWKLLPATRLSVDIPRKHC